MRGVYGHVSPAMRAELRAALQLRWRNSLRQRAGLVERSSVRVLEAHLAVMRPGVAAGRLAAHGLEDASD